MLPELRIVNPDELAQAAAAAVAEQLTNAVSRLGRARLALAGGGTPRPTYHALATSPHLEEVPWADVDVYFGDERCVPAEDPSSNFRMAQEALLSHVAIPASNIHRIRGELAPEDSARAYARVLGDTPLDIVLLGLGGDGHTASLFPETPLMSDKSVLATQSPIAPHRRVSLGLGPINAANVVIFLVAGVGKAERVAEIHAQIASGKPVLPAAYVQPVHGRLIWFLDTHAASMLPPLESS